MKIRGFRVEPGEIEVLLRGYSDVEEAVVVAREDQSGTKRLVAYVTPVTGAIPDPSRLRTHVAAALPDYMVPSAFVLLDQLPLTSNGKLDRKALPAPMNENLGPEQEYVAPRGPVEEIVAAIFAEVLEKDRVGILDNFFESGGHSLLAIQLAGHLRETFQVEVPLRRIFEDPTVAGLAAALLEEEDERPRVQRTAELMVKLADVSDDQADSMLGKASTS